MTDGPIFDRVFDKWGVAIDVYPDAHRHHPHALISRVKVTVRIVDRHLFLEDAGSQLLKERPEDFLSAHSPRVLKVSSGSRRTTPSRLLPGVASRASGGGVPSQNQPRDRGASGAGGRHAP